ncbi:MAG TPA: DUF420 domain-containing protein [Chitinophagales bacterium]
MKALLQRNDKLAYQIIGTLSVVVFLIVVALGKFKLTNMELGFDPHIFAKVNAFINSLVSLLLLTGLFLVKQKKFEAHKNVMFAAIGFSTLFLVTYILHHLLTVDTHFGGQGTIRYFYYPLLVTHIFLAAVILPFILLTAYRGLTADFKAHRQIAKITFPIWLYVSISGVLVYLLISPYYAVL